MITRLTPGVLLPPDHRHELKFLIPITLLDMTTITVIDHGMSLSVLYHGGQCYWQVTGFLRVLHTVNSQWFLEQDENVNSIHCIRHSSPWQWYGYYFNSANFLTNFIWRMLSMFKYDKYITNSLIITKYINIKINVYFWQPGLKKGDNWNANRTQLLIFSWSAIIGPKLFFAR